MSRHSSCFIVALLCFTAVGSAFAHAHLKAEVPARDTVVMTAPSMLRLDFSEGLELDFTGVTLVDIAGKNISTGPASFVPGSDMALMVPVTGHLAAGVYKVNWHALSRDGHKTSGSYTFSIQPE